MRAHVTLGIDGTKNRTRKLIPFTLVEVMVAMAIFSLLIATVLSGLFQIAQFNYMNAQKVVAFGLAYEALENLKAENYEDVSGDHEVLSPAQVKMTHLGGKNRVSLNAWRWGGVEEQMAPKRKNITITIGWNHRGKSRFESITGTIFPE